MSQATTDKCPMHGNIDRRKSAKIAIQNTQPDPGAHWIKQSNVARNILRSQKARQAGVGAESVTFRNPEFTSVFFLDGEDHSNKRRKIHKFLSPKAVKGQHYKIMDEFARQVVEDFKKTGKAKLEEMSFTLAIAVVGEILGLTNSSQSGRARRIQRVLFAGIAAAKPGLSGLFLKFRQVLFTYWFFLCDVKPAMEARKTSPKEDAISHFLEEGYPNAAIIIECLTYGTAGMLTTREFIVMAAWYLFEDQALRQRFLDGDVDEQMAILMEILRLEPVAAMVHRRVHEEVEDMEGSTLPAGELYGIDIRATNVDEKMVGECPFAVDPDRAKRVNNPGRYLSFADGPHSCPGWQVALHETRIFLDQLFRVPGIKLDREPDIGWNEGIKGYELRNADISCDTASV